MPMLMPLTMDPSLLVSIFVDLKPKTRGLINVVYKCFNKKTENFEKSFINLSILQEKKHNLLMFLLVKALLIQLQQNLIQLLWLKMEVIFSNFNGTFVGVAI